MNFIGSPEIVIALALGGKISFNPINDDLIASDGTTFKLNPPRISDEIPRRGFKEVEEVYASADDPDSINVILKEDSERLQQLYPFAEWDKQDFEKLLAKVKGKLTLIIYPQQECGLCIGCQ